AATQTLLSVLNAARWPVRVRNADSRTGTVAAAPMEQGRVSRQPRRARVPSVSTNFDRDHVIMNFIRNLKIGTRLGLGFGLVLLLMGAMIGLAATRLAAIGNETGKVLEQ